MNKQLFLLIAPILLTVSIHAQNISYALKGGLNISSGKVKTESNSYSGMGIGFHAGAIAKITDAKVPKEFSFQPGLMLSLKSAKVKDGINLNINLLTLDIPLTVVYEKNKFFGGLGPNLNIGLTGKYDFDGDKYNLFDKDSEGRFSIRRFEIGLNLLAGYQLKDDMFVSINFTPGLNNLFNNSRYTGSNTKVHTSVIGLSFGKFLK